MHSLGLTSIVIVTYNQLSYTRRCLESIRQHTCVPYELIVVDNGSSDGSVAFLQSWPGLRLLTNAENRGFPAAANQGIAASAGGQILLLNNDTIVTEGWLERLLAVLHRDSAIGLVGPCSNQVSGIQQVPVSYTDLDELPQAARQWTQAHRGQVLDTPRLVGFCLLFRRELVDRIGLLDERFGIGNYEDDDYCRRALAAGYRAVVALDAFVHHFGSVTFKASGVDFGELLGRNRRLFEEKWADQTTEQGEPVTGTPSNLDGGSEGHTSASDVRDPLLSLCMIVRNNSRTLEPCLTSIRPWVDEMIVVDTGSTDDTPQIAQRLGAKVYHFPWCDSFAAARNASLRHARGKWVFWMDSDDTIDATNGRQLKELIEYPADPSALGYVMQVHCPGPGDSGSQDTTVVDHVKLFRNWPQLQFEGRIHEQILPAIRRAGGAVEWTKVFVTHSGSDQSPEGRERKQQRDLRLLELELQDHPDQTFALFNLGMTYADMGRYPQAVEALHRSLQNASSGESHVRKVYALLVSSYCQLGQYPQAQELCQQGLTLYPRDTELRFRQGIVAYHLGHLTEAERAYQAALQGDPERHFASIDQGLLGFKVPHNLAVVYGDLGRWRDAEIQWLQTIAQQPTCRTAWQGLTEALLHQGKLDELDAMLAQLPTAGKLQTERMLIQAALAQARGHRDQTRRLLRSAVAADSQDLPAWRALSQFLFQHGEAAEVREALLRLASLAPSDGSVQHNLGTVYLRLGQYAQAVQAYQKSLELRPGYAATVDLLNQATEQLRQATASATQYPQSEAQAVA